MSGLIMAAQLIMGISILVVLHELGHYLAARAFGIRVEKFYLFFDAWKFRLFRFKKGDTEYGIGWLPLGGYVKIAGMVDESLDREQMKQPPKSWEFRSKPAWQRLIVMVAGVLMNVILGMVIFTFIILNYEKEYLPVDQLDKGVYAYASGREIGFETGDKIISVNGKEIERFKDAISTNVLLGATITVDRNGTEHQIVIPGDFYKRYTKSVRDFFIEAHNFPCVFDSVLPDRAADKAGLKKGDRVIAADTVDIKSYGAFRELVWNSKSDTLALTVVRQTDTVSLSMIVDSTGVVGVLCIPPYQNKKYGLFAAMKYGIGDAIANLAANVRGFGKIISGKENASESLQGPIGIAKIYGGSWNWPRFWLITGLLSMVLAFMNILPIPALDGGHVIFTTIELVTGKKFSDRFMEKAQIVGMVILIALMVFVIGNDFWKHFFR
jgi:regulator of sigma E protease